MHSLLRKILGIVLKSIIYDLIFSQHWEFRFKIITPYNFLGESLIQLYQKCQPSSLKLEGRL